jgi:hypothetical protein
VGARDGTEVEYQHLLRGSAPHRLDSQKKSFLYRERHAGNNLQKREQYLEQLKEIPVECRVYVDEAGVEDTLSYAYGWSPRGVRCPGERLGHRTCRISMAAAWCQGQLLAPLTFEGMCDSPLIEAWFEQQLIRELKPGQVVILDNAAFHRLPRLEAILETVGCRLLPLPPYSPDLNKIEPQWNALKTKIALDPNTYPSFRLKVDAAFA